ncbi:hypothetical protein ATCC90586_008742 [Pythium insidiosum]|nr:hypothetical protein ATCC90586_008742 [Pythium insidiosum]
MYVPRVRCNNITASTVFGFFTTLAFGASCAVTFVRCSAEGDLAPASYVVQVTPSVLTYTKTGLRGLQLVLSTVTLATIANSFETYSDGPYHVRYGSHQISFLLLMAYSGLLLSGWHLVCVERLRLAPRPSRSTSRAIDGVLSALLLCASIAMVTSTYVEDCGMYVPRVRCNNITASTDCGMYVPRVRCNNITASTVFGFFTTLAFGASCALTFVRSSGQSATSANYLAEATPTNATEHVAARLQDAKV